MVNLKLYNNRVLLETDNKELFDNVRCNFSTENPAAGFSEYANARVYAITPLGSFDIGLTLTIAKYLKNNFPNVKITIDKKLLPLIKPFSYIGEIENPDNIMFEYRPYQLNSIKMALKYGRGNLIIPTSGGKSLIIYGIIINLLKIYPELKIMLLVPNTQLIYQMHDDFINYGYDKNKLSIFDTKHKKLQLNNLIISNRQWLNKYNKSSLNKLQLTIKELKKSIDMLDDKSTKFTKKQLQFYLDKFNTKIKKNQILNRIYTVRNLKNKLQLHTRNFNNNKKNHDILINEIKGVIIDEVHQIKETNLISKFIEEFTTPIKFGLTGTLPDSQIDQWNIEGLIGPILYTEEIVKLQKQQYIANINITSIKFIHSIKPNIPRGDTSNEGEENNALENAKNAYRLEYQLIEQSEKFNNTIINIIEKLKGNTLVLFDHIEHGQKLFNSINKKDKFFVDGTVNIDLREKVREQMENNNGIITVANVKCFGTGISITNINNLVFVISGKGTTKIIQAIGRGLRLKDNKTKVNLIDCYHNLYYSEKHYKERTSLYKQHYKKVPIEKSIVI